MFLCTNCKVLSEVAIEKDGEGRNRHGVAECRVCGRFDGIKFPSKTEARVYLELLEELEDGDRLYRQVRFPLLNLAPVPAEERQAGTPRSFSVDFVIVRAGGEWEAIDAKAKNWKSREWDRGRAAFEACWKIPIQKRRSRTR